MNVPCSSVSCTLFIPQIQNGEEGAEDSVWVNDKKIYGATEDKNDEVIGELCIAVDSRGWRPDAPRAVERYG